MNDVDVEHMASMVLEQREQQLKAKPHHPWDEWPAADERVRCTACGKRGACRIKSAGVDRKHRRATMVLQELQCSCGYSFINATALERRR